MDGTKSKKRNISISKKKIPGGRTDAFCIDHHYVPSQESLNLYQTTLLNCSQKSLIYIVSKSHESTYKS